MGQAVERAASETGLEAVDDIGEDPRCCPFCGRSGGCEHLATTVDLGKGLTFPVYAQGGREEAARLATSAFVALMGVAGGTANRCPASTDHGFAVPVQD